jgi:hypothetical protein
MQRRSVSPVAVWRHDDLDILVEGHKKTQEALDRELTEFAAHQFGDAGLADAEQRGGFGLFEAASLHDGLDPEDEFGFNEVLLGAPSSCIRSNAMRLMISTTAEPPKPVRSVRVLAALLGYEQGISDMVLNGRREVPLVRPDLTSQAMGPRHICRRHQSR